jgi:hypothetical protein
MTPNAAAGVASSNSRHEICILTDVSASPEVSTVNRSRKTNVRCICIVDGVRSRAGDLCSDVHDNMGRFYDNRIRRQHRKKKEQKLTRRRGAYDVTPRLDIIPTIRIKCRATDGAIVVEPAGVKSPFDGNGADLVDPTDECED